MKEQIIDYLLSIGFIKKESDEDTFCKKVETEGRELIINGVRHIEKTTIDLEVKYSGGGWLKTGEEETLSTQWQIYINGDLVQELIILSLEDFKSYIK